MHICCAPCSIMYIKTLRSGAIESVDFWFNPNIYLYAECKNRKEALAQHARDVEMEPILEGDYNLREFICNVPPDLNHRCGYCYSVRTEAAVAYVAERSFDGFTSTLFISPYQNYELLRETVEQNAEKYGVEFPYHGFHPYLHGDQEKAREKGLYMQEYCGCVLSEEDRYHKKSRKKEEAMQTL